MILNFTIQNFASIKNKQILSFEAEKSNHLEDYFLIKTNNGHRISKLALIYGANASGKSYILKALDFLRNLVLYPESQKNSLLNYNPFLFDEISKNSPSILSIELIQNDIKYSYEIEFTQKAILNEVLYIYNSSKSTVFKRTTNIEKQLTEIKYGSKINIDKTNKTKLEANTLWNNTVLGGFLKTNIIFEELNELVNWFSNYLFPVIHSTTELDTFVTKNIYNSNLKIQDLNKILQKADFNISNIQIIDYNIPDHFQTFLNEIDTPIEILNDYKKQDLSNNMKIEIEHTVYDKKYILPFDLESLGTKRYYGLAGLLSLLVRSSVLIPIDELESSLHPDLFSHFLHAFLMNSKNSQLIASTHNREILSNKDNFRNDSIWFCNKNQESSTELYSLSDFDSSIIRDTTNIYNAYKIGKLGAVPNFTDYYLDLDNEE